MTPVRCYLCDQPTPGEDRPGEPPVCSICAPPKQKFIVEIEGMPTIMFDEIETLEPSAADAMFREYDDSVCDEVCDEVFEAFRLHIHSDVSDAWPRELNLTGRSRTLRTP